MGLSFQSKSLGDHILSINCTEVLASPSESTDIGDGGHLVEDSPGEVEFSVFTPEFELFCHLRFQNQTIDSRPSYDQAIEESTVMHLETFRPLFSFGCLHWASVF